MALLRKKNPERGREPRPYSTGAQNAATALTNYSLCILCRNASSTMRLLWGGSSIINFCRRASSKMEEEEEGGQEEF